MDFKLKHSILAWVLTSLMVLISADSSTSFSDIYSVHEDTLRDQRNNAQPNSRIVYAIPRRDSDNLLYDNGEIATKKTVKNVKTTIKVNEAFKIKDAEIDDNGKTRTSRALPDEMKRALRQAQKQRPGLFWTLARVTFETFNDTRSAWNQIGDLINDSFKPDPPPKKKNSKGTAKTSGIAKSKSNINNKSESNATASSGGATTSTTEEPFKFTRTGFQDIIRRNVKGLVRLFNIEWKDAWKQSSVTTSELQRSLGKQIFTFLQDNPDAY